MHPGPQKKHNAADPDLMALYLPSSHLVQVMKVAAEYFPAGQGVQLDAASVPARMEIVPARQEEQIAAPASE